MIEEPSAVLRERMLKHVNELIKKVPGARWYALDARQMLGLAALLTAWQAKRAAKDVNFSTDDATAFLSEVVSNIPSLRQDRPGDAPKLPNLKAWADPVTGTLPKNPWAKGSVNLTEQGWLAENEPELAAYLKATANGVTFSYLREQAEAKEARKVLADLQYDEKTHASNPFHGSDVTARGNFIRAHGEAVADFYKREAEAPRLPWQGENGGNLTELMALTGTAPELRSLVNQAAELEKEWGADELQSLRKLEAELAQKRKDAEQLVNRH